MQPIFSSPDTFLAIFRSFDCKADGLVIKDGSGNTPLASADGFSFAASNDQESNNNHKMALKADFDKFKATPDFDKIMGDYTLMTDQPDGQDRPDDAAPAFLAMWRAECQSGHRL